MYLYGRESISSLSEKINKANSDSSLYVKHSETTATGGTSNANKVVKLDSAGKLNSDMLPSIAINEYFEINEFSHEQLRNQRYENGDIAIVVQNGVVKARYLCFNKTANDSDLRKGFFELNSKDGVVSTVNDKTGAVVLNLEATENSLKLKIGNGSGTDVEKSVDIISDTDITDILNNLQ